MSMDNINDYIKFKILKYKHFKFINNCSGSYRASPDLYTAVTRTLYQA